jgi:membrane-associated phospholipid phosphatase
VAAVRVAAHFGQPARSYTCQLRSDHGSWSSPVPRLTRVPKSNQTRSPRVAGGSLLAFVQEDSLRDDELSVSDQSLASPPVVSWRTRHLVFLLLISAVILVGLTVVASQANPDEIDVDATRWIQQFQNPAFVALMAGVSWFGFAPQTWIMPLVVAAPFAVRRLWAEVLWMLGTQAASLVAVTLKDVVHRARPSAELVRVPILLDSPSFPSGHVVQYATLFGFAFFLVFVLRQRSAARTAALVVLALPIALVGPSRLYLGQHWLSDVLGGYAVSAIFLVLYCLAYARWRSRAGIGQMDASWHCVDDSPVQHQPRTLSGPHTDRHRSGHRL